ncbi:unnamed protein product, partial [Ectocarpus sp. 12 AP-2014]
MGHIILPVHPQQRSKQNTYKLNLRKFEDCRPPACHTTPPNRNPFRRQTAKVFRHEPTPETRAGIGHHCSKRSKSTLTETDVSSHEPPPKLSTQVFGGALPPPSQTPLTMPDRNQTAPSSGARRAASTRAGSPRDVRGFIQAGAVV